MNITNTVTNRAMQLAGRQRQLSTSTASNAQHIPPKKWHIINRSMYPIILNFSCLWGKCLRKPLQKCDAEKGHAACHQQTSVADLKGWHLADITQRYQSHVKKKIIERPRFSLKQNTLKSFMELPTKAEGNRFFCIQVNPAHEP